MLVSLFVSIIIVGILLWAVNTIIPMDPKVKQILNVVVVLALLLWIMRAFGVLGGHGVYLP